MAHMEGVVWSHVGWLPGVFLVFAKPLHLQVPPQTQKGFRLDPPNPSQTPSQKVLGGLGNVLG